MATGRVERRLAAIVAADVAGYSRLMGDDEEGTHERVRAHLEGDDIFGDGVNVAACLEALAEPGVICVSRVVRDQVRERLPYAFEDMGEQGVKNIARSVGFMRCALKATLARRWRAYRPPCRSLHRACRSSCCPLPV